MRGGVFFWPYNLDTDSLEPGLVVFAGDRELTLRDVVYLPKTIEVSFEGLSTPEAVRELTNLELFIDRDDLPALEEGEYYLSELIGLQARDESGTPVGVIKGLIESGPQTLLEVKPDVGSAELVPAAEHFIIEVVKGSHVVLRIPRFGGDQT